jgi:hypothetical protein
MLKAGGSYLELEDILNTVEFLLETAIDIHCQQCILIELPKAPMQDSGRRLRAQNLVLYFPLIPGFRQSQWVARSIVPGRELLVGLILVARAEHTGGTEVSGAGNSQSDWGLPGADDRSSDEAGRADGARRDAEGREGRHIGGGAGPSQLTVVERREWMETCGREGDEENSRVGPAGILRVVWCRGLRQQEKVLVTGSGLDCWLVDWLEAAVIPRVGVINGQSSYINLMSKNLNQRLLRSRK